MPLPDELVELLSSEPILEAKLALAPSCTFATREPTTAENAILLCCFDAARLLEEALDFEPGASLLAQGYLPLAACGRRGKRSFSVAWSARGGALVGQLFVAEARTEGGHAAPVPLIGPRGKPLLLRELLRVTQPAPEASLLKRLEKKPPRRSPTGARRTRERVESLSLFD